MTVQTTAAGTRVEWAMVPKVNLLPPEILQARRFRVVQRVLAAVVLATLVLIGAGYSWAKIDQGNAQEALDDAAGQSALLNRQKSQYAEVPLWQQALANAKMARAEAMARDIDWPTFLEDLSATTPSGVTLKTVSVSLPDGGGLGQVGTVEAPDDLVSAGIGTVIISGTADSLPVVATWLRNFTAMKGLDLALLDQAVQDPEAAPSVKIAFSSRIVITPTMLTHAGPQATEKS